MTLNELAARVARRVGAPYDIAHGFLTVAMHLVVESLNRGEEIRIRGVGTLKWVPISGKSLYCFKNKKKRDVEAGYKLKFTPAKKFSNRRSEEDVRPRRRDDETGSRSR